MWIGTEHGGLCRILPNGEVEHFTRQDGLPDINISILHEDKNGRIWVGLRPGIITAVWFCSSPSRARIKSIVERYYREKEGLTRGDWIMDLFETSDGKFLVATTRGLCEWQGGARLRFAKLIRPKTICAMRTFGRFRRQRRQSLDGNAVWREEMDALRFYVLRRRDGTGYTLANSIFENADGRAFRQFYTATTAQSAVSMAKNSMWSNRVSARYNYFGSGGSKPFGKTRRAIGGFRPETDFIVFRGRTV